jgi:hypothetical protein
MMNNTMNAQYQSMMRNSGMVNGAPNDLKRAAAMNNRPYALHTITRACRVQTNVRQQRKRPHGQYGQQDDPGDDGCCADAAGRLQHGYERPAPAVAWAERERAVPKQAPPHGRYGVPSVRTIAVIETNTIRPQVE